MKPVSQTIMGPPTGNSMSACVASLFGLPIWLVPNFAAADIWRRDPDGEWQNGGGGGALWWEAVGKFASQRGRFVVQLVPPKQGEPIQFGICRPKKSLCVATVDSPRGDFLHCVVFDLCTETVVWDPHPDGFRIGHHARNLNIVDFILFSDTFTEWYGLSSPRSRA